MKNIFRAIALILSVIMLYPALPVTAADTAEEAYKRHLRLLGFPEDYIQPLYELHLLHPEWQFEPLNVTALNSKYNWDYVIHMETEDSPGRSLISSSSAYTAYRHPTNTSLYDSGWYQASTAAVEYFMDPRNFLNEKDIFQFEDLSFGETVTVAQVESALEGTFMERALLENGKTYAEYFYQVGKELGINPLHLASRARQEQGKGTSSQISGLGGDKLWYYYSNRVQTENGKIVYAPAEGHTEQELKGYNGLYNFYNINASGTGGFAILLGALKEAKSGTADMAAAWGGSPSWDTRWKSIYGGAYKLCGSYIGNYQNTLYLQKWNVDARSKSASGASRNFWGQYMQNVGAALSEARTAFNALAANDCLDCPYSFLIPVYSGMPASCPDPADGKCEFYAASDAKYNYINEPTTVTCTTPSRNTYFKLDNSHQVAGQALYIGARSYHTATLEAFEFSLDGGPWQTAEGKHGNGFAAVSDYSAFTASTDPSVPHYFTHSIPGEQITAGQHTVVMRGKVRFNADDSTANNCRYYLIGIITVTASQRDHTVTVDDGYVKRGHDVAHGNSVTLPAGPSGSQPHKYFVGWLVTAADGTKAMYPGSADVAVTQDLSVTPMYVSMQMRKGAAVRLREPTSLRFGGIVSASDINALKAVPGVKDVKMGLIICAVPPAGLATLNPASLALSSIPYQTTSAELPATSASTYEFTGDTGNIADYNQKYAATVYIQLTYSNGKSAIITADYDRENATRSPRQVAAAALASTRTYTPSERGTLTNLAK